MVVDVGQNEVEISRIAQYDLVEDLQSEQRELDVLAGNGFNLRPFRGGDSLAPSAGNAGHGMNAAAAQHLDHVMIPGTTIHDLFADLDADFPDDAQEVALRRRSVRTQNEIRPAQRVEMRGMVGHEERHVEQFADFLCGGGGLNAKEPVEGLDRGHVMSFRAHATDAIGDHRHVFGRPAHTELLEAPQLGNLEVGVGDVAVLIEKDVDFSVPFQPGNRIDRDPPHCALPPRIEPAAPYL